MNRKPTSKSQNNFYGEANPVLVAVDCIIFGFDLHEEKLKILLFKRGVEPFKHHWSLVGSFVRPDENTDAAAKRVLQESTGLKRPFLEQLKAYGKVERDPGARVISIAYWSLIKILDSDKELLDQHHAAWISVDEKPDLVLDHDQMLDDALLHLKDNSSHRPIGFELLPEKFTLPKLLKLYSEIYREEIDDRNFRKKILATGLLDKLDSKDKSESKKGAFYYQFNQRKYKELMDKGFNITFN